MNPVLLSQAKPSPFASIPKTPTGLVSLAEAKQRYRGLPINERETLNRALFRLKTLADGRPAPNVDGTDFYVPTWALDALDRAVLKKRLGPVKEKTQEFIAGREQNRMIAAGTKTQRPTTLPVSDLTQEPEVLTRLDPLAQVSGVQSAEAQAEAISPKTFPLARRGNAPIATFDELRRDLGDELYSQGFQKIATLGGRLDPMADPVAWLSGIVLTGSLTTPLEIERTNAFIAQRDEQAKRGEAPPIAQDLKDRIGAAANYSVVASSIFGPASAVSKLALAKSVLKHSRESSLPLFKAKVLRDALDSSDRGFKEAALKLAKTEPPKTLEAQAQDAGVSLEFRQKPVQSETKPEPDVPGFTFRPKPDVPKVEPTKPVEAPLEPTPGLFGRPRAGTATPKATEPSQTLSVPKEQPRQTTATQAERVPDIAPERPRLFQGTPTEGRPTVSKADVDATREARGLSELVDEPAEKVSQWLKEADEKGLDRAWVNRTAEQIAEKPRQLSDAETVAFLKHRQDLIDEFDRLKQIEKPTAKELDDILQVEKEFDRVDEALRKSGTEWGRAGVARQLSISEDFSELGLKARARAAKGSELTPQESKRIAQLSEELQSVTRQRDELLTAQAKVDAENVLKRVPRATKTVEARAKIHKEIDDIFSEFKKIHGGPKKGVSGGKQTGAVSPITAQDIKTLSQQAVLVKRLAKAYIKLGANELADVVSKVQAAFKERLGIDIEGQAVIDAIARTEKRTRSETEAVLRQIKSQADRRTSIAQERAKAQELLKTVAAERKALDEQAAKELDEGWQEAEDAFRARLKDSKRTTDEIDRQIKAANEAKAKGKDLEVQEAQARQAEEQLAKVEKLIEGAEKRQQKMLQSEFDKSQASKRLDDRKDYIKWWRSQETQEDLTDATAKAEWKRWWRAQAAIIDLEEQLATGSFKIPARTTPASRELDDLLFKGKQLRGKVRAEIEAMRPKGTVEKAVEAINSARTLQSVGDFSVLLRQTISTLFRHPFKTTSAFVNAMKGTFSKGVAARIDDNLRNADPAAQLLRERGKLHLPEIGSSGSKAEEAMAGRLVKKLPLWKHVVDASERNMVLTLNQVRASVFDDWVKAAEKAHGGKLPDEELKTLGSGVNALTGRGDFGRFGGLADGLSTIFFAPRFAWSRLQTFGNLFRRGDTAASKVTRNETRKAIVSQVLGTVAIMELAEANGAEVNWTDPTKSDWLQIRVGDRLIDPWGGYRQVARIPARLFTDVKNQAKGEEKSERPLESLAFEFAQYKAGPLLRVPAGVVQGRDFLGKKIEPGFDVPFGPSVSSEGLIGKKAAGHIEPRVKALAEFFAPLSWPEAIEAMEEKDALGLAIAPMVLLGVGTRTEETKKAKTPGRPERSERSERPERAAR